MICNLVLAQVALDVQYVDNIAVLSDKWSIDGLVEIVLYYA